MLFYANDVVKKITKKPNPQARLSMKINGFVAKLMRAERLKDNGYAHNLPPGEPIPVFPIDMLPGCPDGWVRDAGSYVCPVAADWGLWFDWTKNDDMNTAVLPTVKGMNPITGRKLDGLSLEQYSSKCPVHDEEFKGDELFCESCGYKWPPQSYISSPNTLWWDGFRQPDGKVRQFFFSEDEARDIASLVIGKENTVPAFGFAFFKPKEERPSSPSNPWAGHVLSSYDGLIGCSGIYDDDLMNMTFESSGDDMMLGFCDDGLDFEPDDLTPKVTCSVSPPKGILRGVTKTNAETSSSPTASASSTSASKRLFANNVKATARMKSPKKEVAVGAGAEIEQDLARDPLGVDGWKNEAEGVVRLYFCFEEQFRYIADQGIKDLSGSDAGYLEDLPVG
jgi:hypothetical protein